MILGFIFASLVSILFAVYAVPRKHSKQNVILYTMWMGIAYFIGTIILIAIIWGFGFERPENLLNPWHLLTVLRGLIWVLGMAAYNIAIDKIGLTRFNQWKNIQGPVGSILIILFVVPAQGLTISGVKLLYLFFGVTVMFMSALMFQIKSNNETSTTETNKTAEFTTNKKQITSKKDTSLGIVFALSAGVCFGITALLNNIVSLPAIVGERFTFAQLLFHSISLIVFSMILYLLIGDKQKNAKQRLKEIGKVDNKTWLPFIAGLMFLVATLLSIYSYRLISNGSIPWSITQLNVFWTVLIGIFIYKEVNFKQHWLRLILGGIMAIVACVLLFLAM